MKNIIIYSSFFYPNIGGLENYVFDLATELVKLNFNVTIVTENTENYKDFEEINGFKIYRIPTFIILFGKKGKLQFPILNLKLWKIKKTINKIKYDLMITNTRFFSINILGLYLLSPNVKNIIHIEHGSDYIEFKNKILNILSITYDKLCFWLLQKKIKDFYGVSEKVIEFLKRNNIVSKGLMRVGLKIKEFKCKEEIKRKFNVDDNKKIISFVGRLIEEKGCYFLLEAVKKLLSNRNDIILFVAGDGPVLENYKINYQFPEIRFLGKIDRNDVFELLYITDIFVNPSYAKEGGPITLIEAIIYKCIIISTYSTNTNDLIIDNYNGFLIADKSIEDIYDKLNYIIDNFNKKEIYIDRMYNTIKEYYDWRYSLDIIKSYL